MKTHLIWIFSTGLFISSCIDKQYDLSDINPEVSWGGDALTIPLASTKAIALEEMLDSEASELIKVMDGKYALTYETSIPKSSIDVPEINFHIGDQSDATVIEFSNFDFNSFSFDIPDQVIEMDMQLTLPSQMPQMILYQFPKINRAKSIRKLSKTAPIILETKLELPISPMITHVRRLSFKNSPSISIELSIENADGSPLPDKLKQRILVKDYSIKLSPLMDCRSTDPQFNTIINQYTFPDGAIPSGFSVELKAIDFKQDKPVMNGLLAFNLNYTTQGEAYISSIDGLSFDELSLLRNATIKQLVTFDPLTVQNADVQIAEIMFQSNGVIRWGAEPITGVTDYYKTINTLQISGEEIKFYLNVDGDLLKYGDLTIPTAQIILPNSMFSSGKRILTFKNLKIDKNTGKLTSPLTAKIDSLHFPQGIPVENGTIEIEGEVQYFFEVVKPAGAANIEEFNDNLNVTFTMSSGSQRIDYLRGQVHKEMNYTTHLSLETLPDFMKNEENSLLFPAIHLELDLNYNIGFPVDLSLKVQPISYSGSVIEENVVKTDNYSIKIDAAPKNQIRNQKLWIAATNVGMPDSFLFVKVENVENLLRQIPKSVEFDISLIPSPNSSQLIEAKKTYYMNGDATFRIPFVFGAGFKLLHNENIELGEVFTDETLDILFSNSNNELQLLINVFNTIPLNINGAFEALDQNGQTLAGVTVTPNESKPIVILPGSEGNEKKTPIIVSLKGSKDQIKKLKQLKASISIEAKEGESTVGGAVIKPTNTLRMEVKGRVLGNLSFK